MRRGTTTNSRCLIPREKLRNVSKMPEYDYMINDKTYAALAARHHTVGGARGSGHRRPRRLVDSRTPGRHEDAWSTRGRLVDTRTPGRHEDAWSTRGRLVDTRTPVRHKDVRSGGLSGPYKYRGEVTLGRAGPDLSPTPTPAYGGRRWRYLRLRRSKTLVDNSNLSTRHSRDNHVPNRTLGVPL